jgi:hypothetical protein
MLAVKNSFPKIIFSIHAASKLGPLPLLVAKKFTLYSFLLAVLSNKIFHSGPGEPESMAYPWTELYET